MGEDGMKIRFAGALALCLAFSQFAVAPAMAEEASVQFRSAPAQSFSDEDLQRYGLSTGETARAQSPQEQGNVVLTPEEARQYTAGDIDNDTLLIVGGLVLVAVAIVAAD